ncbi:hypothetical protein L1987_86215 [Smallanthus sonchifolius]|uniref:Uncharacterized protein n=1 Tax=Smallanthus sonchifolius TaxID=185202 RepID=A0ACB8XZ53_9ASTR|nr:hypothetical protein L1987_86215 [Smallanthus sonchifolius]
MIAVNRWESTFPNEISSGVVAFALFLLDDQKNVIYSNPFSSPPPPPPPPPPPRSILRHPYSPTSVPSLWRSLRSDPSSKLSATVLIQKPYISLGHALIK